MNSTQAKQRLADLTAEVTQALADVDGTREAVAVGEATERDVERAQRVLAKAEARQEQAKVDLRIASRREEAEAATAAREAERIRRELDAITQAKRDQELDRFRDWLDAVQAQAQTFDANLLRFSEQLRERSTGSYPSRWGSWQFLAAFVADQRQHVTRPGSSERTAS